MKHLIVLISGLIVAGLFWPAIVFLMPKKKKKQNTPHPKAK